jgi:hypothetical protein
VIPLLLGALALLGVGAASREIRSFERAASADIASNLQGDNKEVTVRVSQPGLDGSLSSAKISASHFHVDGLPLFTEPERSQRGKVDLLTIHLRDFSLRSLHVEELRADIADCRYDLPLAIREKQVRLSRSGQGPGYVRLTAPALAKFILAKYREIKTVSVRLEHGKVYVEGDGDFLFFRTRFYVSAKLVPRDGVKLFLEDAWILLDGRPALDGSDRVLLQAINPVLDLDEDLKLMGAMQVESLKAGAGVLEVFGIATVPARVQ